MVSDIVCTYAARALTTCRDCLGIEPELGP